MIQRVCDDLHRHENVSNLLKTEIKKEKKKSGCACQRPISAFMRSTGRHGVLID